MFAFYAKIRPPMETYERGLAEWDTRTKQFQKVTAFATNAPVNPGSLPIGGHPFLHTDQGIRYIYYANPYPLTRVRAEPDELKDPANFERFTCLEPAKPGEESAVARDADGKVLYAWKRGAPGVGPAEQAVLIKAGKLKPGEGLIQLCDVETGKPVQAHGGSVAWNEYRKRWVMIAVEFGGSSSLLGEVWFAEADEPTGPWAYARKVATHEKYSYYNPRHHPFFNQKNGRLIYFEGTYTNTFSGNLDQTPRYDYNQMMYRLDLGDDRLNLPVAVVLPSEPERLTKSQHGLTCPVEFLALDHAGEGTVPIFTDPRSTLHAAFHILPIGSANASKTTTSLYQFIHEGENQMFYSIDPTWSAPGFKRTEQPVGLVWRNPRS